MKKLFILLSLSFLSLGAFAQELPNIEMITIPLQSVELTRHGIVVNYTTSELYQGTFYLPIKWFQATIPGDENAKKVIGINTFAFLGIGLTSSMKVEYLDGVLKQVTLILPRLYEIQGLPKFQGTREEEDALIPEFEKQLALDYLPFDVNK